MKRENRVRAITPPPLFFTSDTFCRWADTFCRPIKGDMHNSNQDKKRWPSALGGPLAAR
jgi:hypothetical protein